MAKKKRKLEISARFLYPKVLLGYKNDIYNDEKYYGISIHDISFGVSLCTYDYGKVFEATIFGFGVSIWWY